MSLKDKLKKIEKRLNKKGGKLILVITDNGEFIEAYYQGKIYRDKKDYERFKNEAKNIIEIDKRLLPEGYLKE